MLLTPADIGAEIYLNNTTVRGLDPGLRDIFVACDGVGTGADPSRQRHRIRKTSTSEYYQLSEFKSAAIKRAKHDRANVDAHRLISNVPSTRTCNWDQFNEVLRYIFRNFEAIKGYYTTGLKKLKFHNYRNEQKALTEMCKRLFTGSRKYQEGNPDIQQAHLKKWKPLAPRDHASEAERPIVIVFGSARFGGLRGNVSSPTKIFRTALLNYIKSTRRNQPNSRNYAVIIDEYFTSQICPGCHTRNPFTYQRYPAVVPPKPEEPLSE